jgi:hypothetical protein
LNEKTLEYPTKGCPILENKSLREAYTSAAVPTVERAFPQPLLIDDNRNIEIFNFIYIRNTIML